MESQSLCVYKKRVIRNPIRAVQTRPNIAPPRTCDLYLENLPKMDMVKNKGVYFNSSIHRFQSQPSPSPSPPLSLPILNSSRKFQFLPATATASSLSPTHIRSCKVNKDQKKSSKPSNFKYNDINIIVNQEKFSGPVFSMSPPPSSLPMPKFSLRPKLMSCKIEATVTGGGVIDSGATDSLCRLLKLR